MTEAPLHARLRFLFAFSSRNGIQLLTNNMTFHNLPVLRRGGSVRRWGCPPVPARGVGHRDQSRSRRRQSGRQSAGSRRIRGASHVEGRPIMVILVKSLPSARCSFSGTVSTCPRFSGYTGDSDYPFILFYGKYAARRQENDKLAESIFIFREI